MVQCQQLNLGRVEQEISCLSVTMTQGHWRKQRTFTASPHSSWHQQRPCSSPKRTIKLRATFTEAGICHILSNLTPSICSKRDNCPPKTWESRWESRIPPHPDFPCMHSISSYWKTVLHQDASVIFILWTPFCNHFRMWFLLQHSPFWIRASSFAAEMDDNSRLTPRSQILNGCLSHLQFPCTVAFFPQGLWFQPLYRKQASSHSTDSPNKYMGRTELFRWRILFWLKTRNNTCMKTAG